MEGDLHLHAAGLAPTAGGLLRTFSALPPAVDRAALLRPSHGLGAAHAGALHQRVNVHWCIRFDRRTRYHHHHLDVHPRMGVHPLGVLT